MPSDLIVKTEEFEDENGVKFVALQFGCRKKENLLKNVVITGTEIAAEVVFVAYSWILNFHPVWRLIVSAMGIVSFLSFCANVRSYICELPHLQRYRLQLLLYLAIGIITYFIFIYGFSEALKRNSKAWIPYIGVAVYGYHLAVSSVIGLGRSLLNRSSFTKFCQLLFGPALIQCAACYLNFRQHEEKWLFCLPMIASALVGNGISVSVYERIRRNYGPGRLQFKVLELIVGGWLCLVNGSMLAAYSVNNQYYLPTNVFYIGMFFFGLKDIKNALQSFQETVEMEDSVFYCICEMIGGPIVFTLGCFGFVFTKRLIMLPVSLVAVGIGLVILRKSIRELLDLVPLPVFQRYCQQVLGPVVIVYGSLVAAHVGYNIGWRSSMLMMPLISAGIYFTYRGFRRRNLPRWH